MSFGKSLGNSYVPCLLIIKSHFVSLAVEGKFGKTSENSQIFITIIVALLQVNKNLQIVFW